MHCPVSCGTCDQRIDAPGEVWTNTHGNCLSYDHKHCKVKNCNFEHCHTDRDAAGVLAQDACGWSCRPLGTRGVSQDLGEVYVDTKILGIRCPPEHKFSGPGVYCLRTDVYWCHDYSAQAIIWEECTNDDGHPEDASLHPQESVTTAQMNKPVLFGAVSAKLKN